MERFVILANGFIKKATGKVVKRQRKGGEVVEMFRTKMGEEYPLERTYEKLDEKHQRQYIKQQAKLEAMDRELENLKNS